MRPGSTIRRSILVVDQGQVRRRRDTLATEEPLEIRLLAGSGVERRTLAVTMRTPGNDFELVIAGLNDFPYTEKVIAEAKKHNVENRIKLIGSINEEEKKWYYQHCNSFVFPSIGEGFGLPVLEAMQFGKPVFISDKTSLPEVGGDAAYYFNNFDPADMQKVFEAGMYDYTSHNRAPVIRQHADRFSWDKAAREYLDVYSNCLKM